jgi:hypothetical protein
MAAHLNYRSAWVAAGYREHMASAIACLPPPAHLLRLYHLTSADHAISDLALGRLKAARFSDLNDPFELIGVNFREREVRKAVRDFKDAYDARTGLLSFSDDWAGPVLWSHYGAKHRGICLGFDVPRDSVQKVQYEDERLLASLGDGGDPLELDADLRQKLLCTKYRHWEYEREYRRFVPLEEAILEGRLHFVSFGKDLELAEVVLGPQCLISLDRVRDLVKSRYSKAVVFQSRLAFKFFHVVPKENTVP